MEILYTLMLIAAISLLTVSVIALEEIAAIAKRPDRLADMRFLPS